MSFKNAYSAAPVIDLEPLTDLSPERKLIFAIILQAIQDYTMPDTQKIFDGAKEWLLDGTGDEGETLLDWLTLMFDKPEGICERIQRHVKTIQPDFPRMKRMMARYRDEMVRVRKNRKENGIKGRKCYWADL